MPDIWSTTPTLDQEMAATLADAREARAAVPSQKAILLDYISEMALPADSNVLEIGCGTGSVSRALAKSHNVSTVTGIDPSNYFIGKASELSKEIANVGFDVGDGKNFHMQVRNSME
jgi:ubiquinone/menaquinone biosynthesis C-methylase UbiE